MAVKGGTFNYAIPVAPGRYRVTLKFAETYPAQFRVRERIFDVYCNGLALLRNFDVYAEAGRSNRACDKSSKDCRQMLKVSSYFPLCLSKLRDRECDRSCTRRLRSRLVRPECGTCGGAYRKSQSSQIALSGRTGRVPA